MKIEKRKNIRHAERSCCVPTPCLDKHFNYTFTNFIRFYLQFFDFFFSEKHEYIIPNFEKFGERREGHYFSKYLNLPSAYLRQQIICFLHFVNSLLYQQK